MNAPLSVLLVDDHPLFREGLCSLIMGLAPSATVTQAGTMEAALEHKGQTFHLILLDLSLPNVAGLSGLIQMKNSFPDSPIVVISGDDNPLTISQSIQAGASGFIPKTTDIAVTQHAIQLVMAHGVYLPPQALNASTALNARHTANTLNHLLSERQIAVLKGLLQGKPNKAIARDMGIAEGTVKAHLWTVYQLLGVSSRTQAMYRAHELELFKDLHDPA